MVKNEDFVFLSGKGYFLNYNNTVELYNKVLVKGIFIADYYWCYLTLTEVSDCPVIVDRLTVIGNRIHSLYPALSFQELLSVVPNRYKSKVDKEVPAIDNLIKTYEIIREVYYMDIEEDKRFLFLSNKVTDSCIYHDSLAIFRYLDSWEIRKGKLNLIPFCETGSIRLANKWEISFFKRFIKLQQSKGVISSHDKERK